MSVVRVGCSLNTAVQVDKIKTAVDDDETQEWDDELNWSSKV
jgi:hypothetical protein